MPDLPAFIQTVFIITTFLTVYLFLEASRQNRLVLAVCSLWLTLQAFLAFTGFYTSGSHMPPRIMLAVVPMMLLILIVFITPAGKKFIDALDVRFLCFLHVVRFPVEIVLFWLFCEEKIPEIMTFEGRNFDIIAGITAPIIGYLGYIKKRLSPKILLGWNIICLLLLLNIVFYAVLSVPSPFQTFGQNQPNVAVLYFPFVWLPAMVVPLVLFSHLVLIRKLVLK